MIFEEKAVTLRNGKQALLKSPEITDAGQLLGYIQTACGETPFLARYPEEWDTTTVAQEEAWIQNLRSSPNILEITCFLEGAVAGSCEIQFRSGLKDSHRGTVSIAILREHWGLGIGTAMFTELIAAARNRGLEILELEFVEGNHRAQRLYERLGFQVVCKKPRAFKLKDGTYLAEYAMQKYL